MSERLDSKYDVIIIGAGIGGLVCGCYLAKAGVKVLIVEKHDKPGGYCTSFKRNGYKFDVGVHYLGACRNEGETGRIFRELSLSKDVILNRIDPSDKIIIPGKSIFIRKDSENTVEEFKNNFQNEHKNIESFFGFIQNKNFLFLYSKIKNLAFLDLLKKFSINNKELIAALSIPLGNIGLPPSSTSALTATTMYREFILDPGYYPEGGMQAFPDALVKRLKEYGSHIVFSEPAKQILIKNKKVCGVNLENKGKISADIIVSNVDAFSTFSELVIEKNENILQTMKKMRVSNSAFAIYLALDIDLNSKLKDHCSTWYFSTFDIEYCYGNLEENLMKKTADYILCTFPSLHSYKLAPKGKSTMGIFILAPYLSMDFWQKHKEDLSAKMIRKAEDIIPNLSKHIEVIIHATPHTFKKYTSNTNGALYGWASTPAQVHRNTFPQKTYIKNLYLAGHWCTHGLGQGGVSVVAFSGRNAAKLILKEHSKKNNFTMTKV